MQRETEQAPDPPVSVFLELDRVQEQVGRGLRFAVVISNESDEPLVLTDVTEKLDDIAEHLVNIRLTDADGTRVELPSAGSIGRVNTKDPEGYRASWADRRTVYRVPEDPRARPAQTKTPDDVDDGTITLNPGESYRVAYAVTRVLRDAKQYRGRERELFESGRRPATGEMERPPTAPIAGGRYLLWLEVYLTGPLTTNPFLRCFKLEKGINGIEVQLGGP